MKTIYISVIAVLLAGRTSILAADELSPTNSVAAIYEDWFRVDTYYREDTRSLYMQLLPQFIEELAQETCAAQGVKLEPQFQPIPPVSPLNKPPPPDKKPAAT